MARQVLGYSLDDGPVLVTGAAGFAGRNLMSLFPLGPGDFASDVTDAFPAPPGVERVSWPLPGPAPSALGRVRYVIHLAGLSSVAHSHRSGSAVEEVNAGGTAAVADWVRDRCPEARILLAGSAEVYRPSSRILDEDCVLEPRSPYGKSKLMAERKLASRDLDWVISRSFPHFGPWQQGHFVLPSFCRRLVQAARSGKGTITTGNLSAVRDYLYIEDVVRAYACLLSRGRSRGVYNVCSGIGHSIGELLDSLTGICGAPVEPVTDPGLLRNGDQFRQVGDPCRLKSLGWEPEVGLRSGLELLYRWWEERL